MKLNLNAAGKQAEMKCYISFRCQFSSVIIFQFFDFRWRDRHRRGS